MPSCATSCSTATFGATLFPGGNFVGQDAYEGFIQQNFNMGVQQFEQLLKTDLLIRKLTAAVQGGVTVSDQELEQQYRRENTKVKFDYAVVDAGRPDEAGASHARPS